MGSSQNCLWVCPGPHTQCLISRPHLRWVIPMSTLEQNHYSKCLIQLNPPAMGGGGASFTFHNPSTVFFECSQPNCSLSPRNVQIPNFCIRCSLLSTLLLLVRNFSHTSKPISNASFLHGVYSDVPEGGPGTHMEHHLYFQW